jgi:hypothetical protein
MYLAGWKGFLPVGEVHVPRQLEGKLFQPARMCLNGWKETLPAGHWLWDTWISARFGGKNGHLHHLAGICWYQRISDIRNQL